MKVVINRNYKNMSFGKNNILINCPTINSYNNKHRKTLGGIESLVLSLADELSKRKFNITLSSSCKKTFIKNDISYVPIDKIKKNPQKFIFNSIISTNDATIFNDFKENQNKIIWLHNKLQIEKSIRKKQFFSIIKNNFNIVYVSDYLKDLISFSEQKYSGMLANLQSQGDTKALEKITVLQRDIKEWVVKYNISFKIINI